LSVSQTKSENSPVTVIKELSSSAGSTMLLVKTIVE
jgi:hypothetical protein